MPLTFEQFKGLRSQGLSVDQITRFERGEKPEAPAPPPPPPPSLTTGQKIGKGIGAGLGQAKEAGLGALKSIPATLNNLSQLGQRGLGALTSWIPGMQPAELASLPKKLVTPTNQDQAAGFLGGQLAQTYMIPNKAITGGATKVASLANAGRLQPLVTTGAKAVAEGLTGATAAKLQGQSDKAAKVAGFLSGGLSLAGSALAPFLKTSAQKSYSQALGATTKQNKAVSDKVVPELIERKQFAFTRTGLMNKAAGKAETAGENIEEAYAALPKGTQSDWRPVLDKLQQEKNALKVNGVVLDEGKYNALHNVQNSLLKVAGGSVDDAQAVSVDSARKARQILDRAIAKKTSVFGLTGTESDVLAAQKEAANAIRGQFAKEHPDIAVLNKEYTFWKNVQDVLSSTIQRTKSQSSLSGELAQDTGAIVGATVKGTVGTAAQYAVVGKLLNATVKSTGWRTASALTKSNLADFLAKGELAKATTLLQRLLNRD